MRLRLSSWPKDENVRATLKPAETPENAVRSAFEARQRERGDPVLEWGEDVTYTLRSAVTGAECDLRAGVALGTSGLENDAIITIAGDVLLESLKPRECFADTFSDGDKMDYQSCAEVRASLCFYVLCV